MKFLTKSLFMNGQQCSRLLWLSYNKKLPEISLSDKHKFNQGREFEKYVKLLFPQGVDLKEIDRNENIEQTKKLIKQKKIIFEAGIQYNNLFLKVDILEPDKGSWNLYEIKATTEVKDNHYSDLAFQKYVCEKAGLRINKCFIFFLNKNYIKNGKINPKDLTFLEDVTNKVNVVSNIVEDINKYLQILDQEDTPDILISKDCNKPQECALKNECWNTLPENNVLQLTDWRTYWQLFNDGIIDINDIPVGISLKDKDKIISEAVKNNKIFISQNHIKQFLDSLHYPLNYFDFETFDSAVPIFDKSRPYQKIPFQYSLHIQNKDGKLEHFEFLATGKDDPRLSLLKTMKSQINKTGDIIVYYKTFEVTILKELAQDFPEYKEWIEDILLRIVDLAAPFQNYHYYNPEQKGRYSLKKVLPAITGKGYTDLLINNGGDASVQFFYSHIMKEITDKKNVRENLLKYCCLDTEGMVWIINNLKKLVNYK